MALFKTIDRDVRKLQLSFALQLFDGVTKENELLGTVTVRLKDQPEQSPYVPFAKTPEATFLFFALPDGDYTAEVRSDEKTPYYLPVNLRFTIPRHNERWPAIPDFTLADPSLDVDDPAQPQAFRSHLQATRLRPTTAYPFPADATLIRGTVTANNVELADAVVGGADGLQRYRTTATGEYVLVLSGINGVGQTISVQAQHPSHGTVKHDVKVVAGAAAFQDFEMQS